MAKFLTYGQPSKKRHAQSIRFLVRAMTKATNAMDAMISVLERSVKSPVSKALESKDDRGLAPSSGFLHDFFGNRSYGAWLVAGIFTASGLLWLPTPAKAIDNLADLVEKLMPSVVEIEVVQVEEKEASPLENFEVPPGSPFEDFFRRFRDFRHQEPRESVGAGSGFVIDESGLIVTNFHVINRAARVRVRFNGEEEGIMATVKGVDERLDLALIQIETDEPLNALEWGSSADIRIGEEVFAIGSPLGIGQTVTAGIVSARARNIGQGPYDDFIQTDAAINRGNSGGPLFDRNGRVIGINSAILSQTGGSIGIGFAIPSDRARSAIDQIRTFGETRRGWLGVGIQEVTPDLAESLGFEKEIGALVTEVFADGPAEVAGFKSGDVIVEFNDREVPSSRALPWIVANAEVGAVVPVIVFRDGKRIQLTVTLGRLEKVDLASVGGSSRRNEPVDEATSDVLGISVADSDSQVASRFDLPESPVVVVTQVNPGNEASRKGVVPGTIIVTVDRKPIKRAVEFRDIVAEVQKSGEKRILLLLELQGRRNFLTLSFDPKDIR